MTGSREGSHDWPMDLTYPEEAETFRGERVLGLPKEPKPVNELPNG